MKILKYCSIAFITSFFFAGWPGLFGVETRPVGYTTWTVSAGTGIDRNFTTLSLPLYQPASANDGVSAGVISAVASDSITVTNAGWKAGQLSDLSAPFCLRITSGAAEGRNLLISASANTIDTVNIDLATSGVSSLASLGIMAGTDTFELIECDTLTSLFGSPSTGGVVGGTYQEADVLWLFTSGAWSKFYYDNARNRWTKFTLGLPDASNQVVLPDAGILYSRRANLESEFLVYGTVPHTDRQVTINGIGITVVGSSWPVDVRLDETGFEQIPEWKSSSSINSADYVWVLSSGSWSKYYHDGTNWRKRILGIPISDDFLIPSGSAVFLQRNTPVSSDVSFSQSIPYTL